MFPECFCGPFFPSINCEVSTNTTIHFVLSDPGLGRNSKENQSWIFIGRTDAEVATRCEELTHWKRPWCWEGLKVGGEGDDRGWDGWMASPTQWTRVWANSGGWWWTGKLGVLQSMGSQRVRHDWVTELTDWLTEGGISHSFSFSWVLSSRKMRKSSPEHSHTPGLPFQLHDVPWPSSHLWHVWLSWVITKFLTSFNRLWFISAFSSVVFRDVFVLRRIPWQLIQSWDRQTYIDRLGFLLIWGVSPGGASGEEHPPKQKTWEMWVPSLGWEEPWRKPWQPTPVFLPGKSHGHRSLVGYHLGLQRVECDWSDWAWRVSRIIPISKNEQITCEVWFQFSTYFFFFSLLLVEVWRWESWLSSVSLFP